MSKFDYEENFGERKYDDRIAREAVRNIKDKQGEYHLLKNNCQDFISNFRREYERIEKKEKQNK